jgi:hypothetical protein
MNPFFHDEETYVGYALDFVCSEKPLGFTIGCGVIE